MERMEKESIVKRVYVGEFAGSRSMSRLQKRWSDTMKDYLKKRGFDVRQPRGMVNDRSVLWEFEGECMGHHLRDEPSTFIRCHSYMMPLKRGILLVASPTT